MKLRKDFFLDAFYLFFFLWMMVGLVFFYERKFILNLAFLYAFFLSVFFLFLKGRLISSGFYIYSTFVFLFFLILLFTSLFSDYIALSVFRIFINFLPMGLIWLFIRWGGYDKIFFVRVLRMLLWFSIIGGVYSILLFFLGEVSYKEGFGSINKLVFFGVEFIQVFMGGDLKRLSSFHYNPNMYGFWSYFSLCIAVYFYYSFHNKKKVYLFILFFLLICLLMSMSRSAVLSFFVFFVLFNILSSKNTGIVNVFLFLISAILFYLIVEYSGLLASTSRLGFSLNNRGDVWSILFDKFLDNLFVGVGFGVVNEAVLEKGFLDIKSHSAHMQFLVETGLLGYTAFLLTYIWPIIFSIRQSVKENRREYRVFYAFSAALLSSFFIHQFFEGFLFRSGLFTYLWFYISLYVMAYSEVRDAG